MNILVPLELPEPDESVLNAVRCLAGVHEGHVYLLHAVRPESPFTLHGLQSPGIDRELYDSYQREYTCLSRIAQELSGFATEAVLVPGCPKEAIIHAVECFGIDLVVMGSHGHGRIHDLLLSSVTEDVMRHVGCPVMVVPSRRP